MRTFTLRVGLVKHEFVICIVGKLNVILLAKDLTFHATCYYYKNQIS